jgi:hypothetical protein
MLANLSLILLLMFSTVTVRAFNPHRASTLARVAARKAPKASAPVPLTTAPSRSYHREAPKMVVY